MPRKNNRVFVVIGIAGFLFGSILSGCGQSLGVPVFTPSRYEDTKYGIVCYSWGSSTLQCLKVDGVKVEK